VEVIFGRRHVVAAVGSIVLLACVPPTLRASTVATGKDRLASAIEDRLNRLGHTTVPMAAPEGYFYRNPILPQRAFYTYAGCKQRFRFSVFVYRTKAQARVMADYFHQHVVKIGGDFHAFKMVRRGRVVYAAATAPAPDPDAPAVPTRDFHSFAAEVSTALPARPRGCPPEL